MPNLRLTQKPMDSLIVSSEFGRRIPPNPDASSQHKGIDFPAPADTRVYAAHNATVIRAGWSTSFGNFVTLQDTISGQATFYGHLNSQPFGDVYYRAGRRRPVVQAGDLIGLSGNKGSAAAGAFHLHFEIYPKDIANFVASITAVGGTGLDPKKGYARLNPRPYLADLAIYRAQSDLAESDPGFDRDFTELSLSQQQLVYARSSDIFTVAVQGFNFGIELDGDRRDNRIISNMRSNGMVGFEGKDSYIFPDEFKSAGHDVIIDDDGILELGDVIVSGIKAKCLVDSKGAKIDGSWKFVHNGSGYYAARVNRRRKMDVKGTDLVIVPFDSADDSNALTIQDFDFKQGAFGIELESNYSSIIDIRDDYLSWQHTAFPLAGGDKFAVSYRSAHQGEIFYKPTYQIFNSDQEAISGPIFIERGYPSDNGIAPLGNGKIAASWKNNNGQGDVACYGQIFDEKGATTGVLCFSSILPETLLTIPPYVVATTDSRFAIFYGSTAYYSSVYGAIISGTGALIRSEFEINSYKTGQVMIFAGSNKFGQIMVCWVVDDSRVMSNNLTLHARIIDSNGAMITPEFVAINNQLDYTASSYNKVIPLSNGNFLVNFYMRDADGLIVGYAQIFNSAGSIVGERITVAQPSRDITFTKIVPLVDGGFVVLNNDYSIITSHLIVKARLYDNNGAVISDSVEINGRISGDLYDAAALDNGGLVICYGSSGIYYGRILDKNLQVVAEEFLINPEPALFDLQGPVIVPLRDGQSAVSWKEYDSQTREITAIHSRVFDEKGLGKQDCQPVVRVPVISQVAELIDLTPQTATVSSSPAGSNIFNLASAGEETVITAFKGEGMAGVTYIDQLDHSQLVEGSEEYDGVGSPPADPPHVVAIQQGDDVLVDYVDYGVSVVLRSFRLEYLTANNFAAPVDLRTSYFTVDNLPQEFEFTQINSTVALRDMVIHPLDVDDEFEVTITLRSAAGEIITDPDKLSLQIGTTEDGSASSFFRDGVWRASGNATQINDLMMGLTADLGEDFAESFVFDIEINDTTHDVSVHNSSRADYECVALPLELRQLIDDQETEAGQKLVMNLIRYFADPNDPDYERAIFNLTINLSRAEKLGLDITKLNGSSFALEGKEPGHFELLASLHGECQQVINQTFALDIADSAGHREGLSSGAIAGIITGGALLTLTAGLCILYKNRDHIRNFCSKLTQAAQGERKDAVDLKDAKQSKNISEVADISMDDFSLNPDLSSGAPKPGTSVVVRSTTSLAQSREGQVV